MSKKDWPKTLAVIILLVIGFALSYKAGTDLYDKILNGLLDQNSNGYCLGLVNQVVNKNDFRDIALMSFLGGIFIGIILAAGLRNDHKSES